MEDAHPMTPTLLGNKQAIGNVTILVIVMRLISIVILIAMIAIVLTMIIII